jgi:hypothetical protein
MTHVTFHDAKGHARRPGARLGGATGPFEGYGAWP